MTSRDEQLQDAFDRGDARLAAGGAADAELAAYAAVFAALEEDAGFGLPADFAERMTALVVPAPVRRSVYERWVLPVLLAACAGVALPALLPALAKAAGLVLSRTPAAAAAALALLAMACLDAALRRIRPAPRSR